MQIVCPFDNSSPSRTALLQALDTAQRTHAALTVVYAVDEWKLDSTMPEPITRGVDREYEHGMWVLEQAESLAEEFGYPITTEILEGRPADAITEYCDSTDTDFLIVGTREAVGSKAPFVSSVTDSLRRCSACPIHIIPHRELPQS
jgi:nucleotide-binding universal stress UspA family protein